MRILIITTFFPPENSIASLRPYSWAKYWAKQGHDVTVATLPQTHTSISALDHSEKEFRVLRIPQYLHAFFSDLKSSAPLSTHTSTSLLGKIKAKCLSYLLSVKKKKGFFHACRMPDKTDLWIRPCLRCLEKYPEWDLIVSTSGPYTTHQIARKLKEKKRARVWIADFRDPWSDNTIFPGLFPFNLYEKYLERSLLRKADLITTVSPLLCQQMGAKHGLHKTFCVENGIDTEDYLALDKSFFFPKDNKCRIVHTGTVYDGINNPFPLLDALSSMGEDAHRFEVIFCGVHGSDLPLEVSKRGLEHCVKLMPPQKRELALIMQRDADFLLFLPYGNIEKNGILSGKIFEYFYSGTPIIAVGGDAPSGQIRILDNLTIHHAFNSDTIKIRNFLLSINTLSLPTAPRSPPQAINQYTREALAEKMLGLYNLFESPDKSPTK